MYKWIFLAHSYKWLQNRGDVGAVMCSQSWCATVNQWSLSASTIHIIHPYYSWSLSKISNTLPRSHPHSPPLYTPLQRLLDPSHYHCSPLTLTETLHSSRTWVSIHQSEITSISEAACTRQRVTDADSFFYELLFQKILLVVRQNARWLSFVSVLFLPMKQKEFCGPQHIGCKYIPHDVRLDMKYSLIYFL